VPKQIHGHSLGKRGATKRSPTYNSWRAMYDRCFLKSSISYKYYGAIGITVCAQWRSFERFLEDMGERPEGHVLSRFNDQGNYEPGNVTWKLLEENSSEKKTAVGIKTGNSKLTEDQVLEIRKLGGKGYGMRELGRIFNVNHKTISAIIKRKTWNHI
jgi:hypothetical protein